MKKPSKKLLAGVVCCVEAKNSDGTDASRETEKVLRSLGAEVESGGVRMGLTHMIWSNGNIKMVRAAEFMDIIVVSPLWVEQCRESAKLVSVDDFIVSPEDSTNALTVPSRKEETRSLPVPISRAADEFDDPDEFSSSQRMMDKTTKRQDSNEKKESRRASKVGVIKKVKSAKNAASEERSDPIDSGDDTEPPTRGRVRKTSLSATSAEGKRSSLKRNSSGAVASAALLEEREVTEPPKRRRVSYALAECDGEEEKRVAKTHVDVTNKKHLDNKKKSPAKNPAPVITQDNVNHSNEDKKSEKFEHEKVVEKKTIASKKTTVSAKERKTKLVVTSPVSGGEATRAVLSVSGFSSEERSLLEDVIESLISQQHQKRKQSSSSSSNVSNCKKVKSKSNSTSVEVSLQQADPQMELPLIKALTAMTHVVAPADPNCNRTLRILFAMARHLPVLTPPWVYAALDTSQWQWVSTDYAPFLHSRFNSSSPGKGVNKSSPSAPDPLGVHVGPCGDPSRRVVEALVDCFEFTFCTSFDKAAFVIMGNPEEALGSLFSKSSSKQSYQYVEDMQKKGRILSCKEFFDCIEQNEFPPSSISRTTSKSVAKGVSMGAGSGRGRGRGRGGGVIQQPTKGPRVSELREEDEEDEMALVLPSRVGKGRASQQKPTVAGEVTSKEMASSSVGGAGRRRSTPLTGGHRGEDSGDDDESAVTITGETNEDYTDCLVTTPFSADSLPSPSRRTKRSRGSDVAADVTLVDSEGEASPFGSEMSFQGEVEHCRAGNKKRGLRLEEDEETAQSSYQSGEGSPCW